MTATITYKNGSVVTAEMSGNCFILDTKPAFPRDLSIVKVVTADEEIEYRNAIITDCASVDGRYWWCFVEQSPLDLLLAQSRADIDYLEMENESLASEAEQSRADIDYAMMLLGEEVE